jgi:aspartyl-tRNA(Asn)/glutamyl-tRNA(Gln) amidotransferase subunit B
MNKNCSTSQPQLRADKTGRITSLAFNDYEAVIGLEIHAQLKTNSKMFCRCSVEFGEADNANSCPVCSGMPGALPVLNAKALEYSVKTGLALNGKINLRSVFARKNYFYPDMPRGYQISQYEQPIVGEGFVEIHVDGESKKIGIERAHMEEDAGKSTHQGDYTLINLNRASTPLLEIVSKPELSSPQEAAEYARTVRRILRYLDVCDGNLEEGSLRCDCNISVRKKGETKLGTKVEIKNINSFRFVEKALQYEIDRQIDCVESQQPIVQETRLYDMDRNRTFTMRTKEDADDYRYFPDPDLLPVVIAEQQFEQWKSEIPELPAAKAQRFEQQYGLQPQDSDMLTDEQELANYFEEVAKASGNAKQAANWVMGELMYYLKEDKLEITQSKVNSQQLGQLIELIEKDVISGKIAKGVLKDMWQSGQSAQEIVEAQGLAQISDSSAIEAFVDEVINEFPDQVQQFKEGKDKVIGFLVGQIMKKSKGQAKPATVNQLLKEKLK